MSFDLLGRGDSHQKNLPETGPRSPNEDIALSDRALDCARIRNTQPLDHDAIHERLNALGASHIVSSRKYSCAPCRRDILALLLSTGRSFFLATPNRRRDRQRKTFP